MTRAYHRIAERRGKGKAKVEVGRIEAELRRLESEREKYATEERDTYWTVAEPSVQSPGSYENLKYLEKSDPEDMKELAYWRAVIDALDRAIAELHDRIQKARQEFVKLAANN